MLQLGLKKRCKISIKTGFHFNAVVSERDRALTTQLYVKPKEDEIFVSFLLIEDNNKFERDTDDAVSILPLPPITTKRICITEIPVKSRNIRNNFAKEENIEFVALIK